MLIKTIADGRRVIKRLLSRSLAARGLAWVVLDTEGQAKSGFPKDDVLVLGRADILVFSVCSLGEAYHFPTCHVDAAYPTAEQWILQVFVPLVAADPTATLVCHNANYDVGQMLFMGFALPHRIYCSMIGAWKANADLSKGLKERSLFYGRQLRLTSNVDFSSKAELFAYAEEDVVATDEFFQMQRFGYVERLPEVEHWQASPGRTVMVKQWLPSGRFRVQQDHLAPRDHLDLRIQEFPYMRLNLTAERQGVLFDYKRLERTRQKAYSDQEQALKEVMELAGRDINLNSPKQIGGLFEELGISSPKRTKKGAPSYGSKALLQMQGDHPIVQALSAYRKVSKMLSAFIGDPTATDDASRLGIARYCDKNGYLHPTANSVGAVTGRGTCALPNLTQMPAQADTYDLRDHFWAPRNASIISLDYSGLELRVDALYSKDDNMTRILSRKDGDIHQFTADDFQIPRSPAAKQVNFLLIYGGEDYILSEQLTSVGFPCTQPQAIGYIDRFNRLYPGAKAQRLRFLAEYQEKGYIRLFTGRRRWFAHPIDWSNKYESHKAETTLTNNAVQGAGQDFLKAAIIRACPTALNPDREVLRRYPWLPREHKAWLQDSARRVDKVRKTLALMKVSWRFQVHDEAFWYCFDRSAEGDAARLLAEIMTWRHFFPAISDYNVPLVVEGGVGLSWQQAKSKKALVKISGIGFTN